jgi:hypothetical protein
MFHFIVKEDRKSLLTVQKKKKFLPIRRALPINKCGFREMLTARYNRL